MGNSNLKISGTEAREARSKVLVHINAKYFNRIGPEAESHVRVVYENQCLAPIGVKHRAGNMT